MTTKQAELAKDHGTPAQFAVATYQAVPGTISMDEAREAVEKYSYEWKLAGMTESERQLQAAEDEVKRLMQPDIEMVRQARHDMAVTLSRAARRIDLTVPEALTIWKETQKFLAEFERPVKAA